MPFSDVPQSRWSYNVIEKSARTGRIKGFPDGTFRPEQAITREQMAQILYNVPYTWGQVGNYLRKATVYVEKGYSHGSGAVLANGNILTAAHVAYPSLGYLHPIKFYDGRSAQAVVTAIHPSADIAMLKLTSSTAPDYLDVADEVDIVACDEIMLCGHPGTDRWKLSKQGGEVFREKANPTHEFDGTIQVSGGNSGGPVVDQCLDLVGIVVQSFSVNGSPGFEAVNVMKFKDWITQNMQ